MTLHIQRPARKPRQSYIRGQRVTTERKIIRKDHLKSNLVEMNRVTWINQYEKQIEELERHVEKLLIPHISVDEQIERLEKNQNLLKTVRAPGMEDYVGNA